PKYTTLDTTPVSKEKPYLYLDDAGKYNVFVPSAQKDSTGATWATGSTPGKSIPLTKFFVAKPGDSAAKINSALLLGKYVLLTPVDYHANRTLNALWPSQVVLGLGRATVIPVNGVFAMQTPDVTGIDISGIMFDAGTVNSPALLQL